MIINDKSKPETTRMGLLTRGDVFTYLSSAYVRGTQDRANVDATRLKDGMITKFSADAHVVFCPTATLILTP